MAFIKCLFCYRLNNFLLSDIIQGENEVNGCDIVNNLFKGDILAEAPKSPQIGILRVLFLFENSDVRCE